MVEGREGVNEGRGPVCIRLRTARRNRMEAKRSRRPVARGVRLTHPGDD
jgi:hypothetical protein